MNVSSPKNLLVALRILQINDKIDINGTSTRASETAKNVRSGGTIPDF
jgi:hypothetical protein